MDQINKNIVCHYRALEKKWEWELSYTANEGANLYSLFESNLAMANKIEMYPVILLLLLVIYTLQKF